VGLWLLACWDSGLDSCQLHGCLCVVSAGYVVQVLDPATGRSLVQGTSTKVYVCVCVCVWRGMGGVTVIKYNNTPLYLNE